MNAAAFSAIENLVEFYESCCFRFGEKLNVRISGNDVLSRLRSNHRERGDFLCACHETLHELRSTLVQTGFPAPDDWLGLDPIASLTTKSRLDLRDWIHGKNTVVSEETRMVNDHIDFEALRRVCREMRAAIIRIESGDECGDAQASTESSLIRRFTEMSPDGATTMKLAQIASDTKKSASDRMTEMCELNPMLYLKNSPWWASQFVVTGSAIRDTPFWKVTRKQYLIDLRTSNE